jgi:hypothetical protein
MSWLQGVKARLRPWVRRAAAERDLQDGQLYRVSPFDPAAFLAAPAVPLAVAAVAALVPAWRAARVNPVAGLRHD